MQRAWSKSEIGEFVFSVNGEKVVAMSIEQGTIARRAVCRIGNREVSIQKTGLWRTTLELRDSNGTLIGIVRPEKWYANSWLFDYDGKSYNLSVRNNPLAEWVVALHEVEVLAYGLVVQDGSVQVRIQASTAETDLLLDCLLWYFFAPIAMENMSDALSFLLLLSVTS